MSRKPSAPLPTASPRSFFSLIASRFRALLCLLLLLVGAGFLAYAAAPTAMTISQTSGTSATGAARRFTITYTDPDGWVDLQHLRIQINTTQTGAGGLYGYYNRGANKFYFYDDDGTTLMSPTGYEVGSANAPSNSQGTFNCADTTVTTSGNTITIGWVFTPSSTFTGIKNVYGLCRDATTTVGWDALATWTINSNAAPTVLSLVPASGATNSGVARDLAITYRDTNGGSSLREMRVIVDTAIDNVNNLSAIYNDVDNKLYLHGDNGTLMPVGYAPGSANVLTNSQGSLNCADTSVTVSGNNVVVNWNFTPSAYVNSSGGNFAGAKNIYAYCKDSSNTNSGWQTMGNWTVNTIPATAPANDWINASPVSTLTSQPRDFTTRYSDSNGGLDIAEVSVLVSPTTSTANSLCAKYIRSQNKVFLSNDAGGFQATGYAPGSANVLSNAQGSLDCANVEVRTEGKYVFVDWRLTPQTNFVGNKNVYGLVKDAGGLTTGWTDLGDWEIELGPPARPTGLAVSVAANKQITLTWSAADNATTYKVYYNTTTPLVESDLKITTGPTNRTHTITGASGRTYYFGVKSYNTTDTSDMSDEVSATIAPDPPTNLEATPLNGAVKLDWDQPIGATNYNVYRGTVSGGFNYASPVNTTPLGAVNTYTATASNNTKYYFVVRAINAGGTSASSNEDSATPLAPPGAPAGASAKGATSNVQITWTMVAGLTYKIYRSTDDVTYTPSPISANATSPYSDSGLANGIKYYYKIFANNGVADSVTGTKVSATALAAPVVTAATGGGQITLTWPVVPGATAGVGGYKVFRSTTTQSYNYLAPLAPTSATATVVTYIDPSPTIGTPYYYVVRAIATDSESNSSTEDSATRPPAPVAPVLDAVAGNDKVTLSWSAVPNTSTLIYRSTTNGVYNYASPLVAALGVGVQTYTDNLVDNGTTYYYVVRATNTHGTSVSSNQEVATPIAPPSSAPTALTALGGTSKVTLSWTAAAGGPGYRVYRKSGAGAYALVGTPTPATATSFVDSSPAPTNGTLYTYTVRAFNGGGESADSVSANATPIAAPANFAVSTTNGTMDLSWSAVPGATGYNVYRKEGAGAYGAPVVRAGNTNVTYTDASAAFGVAYTYLVRATNTVGLSDPSLEKTATRVAPPASSPTLTTATAGTSKVFLEWTAVAGSTGYQIYRSNGGGALTAVAGGLTTGLSITDGVGTGAATGVALTNNVVYTYTVCAVNVGGSGPQSATKTATPIAAPANFAVSTTNGTMDLSWSAVPGATGYNVYRKEGAGAYGAPVVRAGNTNVTYTDASAAFGVAYTYLVRATNTVGLSDPSLEKAGTRVAPPVEITKVDLLIGDAIAQNGDNIYYPDPQVKDGETASNQLIAYKMTLQNEGSAAGMFRLSGRGDTPGWRIRYFDQWVGGTDVSSQIKSGSYSVPVGPGSALNFRIEVTPDATVPQYPAEKSTKSVSVSAYAESNSLVKDVITTDTKQTGIPPGPPTPIYKPDALVRLASELPYLGDSVYTTTPGANQSRSSDASTARPAVFDWKVINKGSVADTFNFKIPVVSGWDIHLFDQLDGGADVITFAQNGSGYTTDDIPIGQAVSLRLEIKPQGGTTADILLTAASQSDSSKKDVIKAIVTANPGVVTASPKVTFTGTTVACAGGINNSLHKLNFAVNATQGGSPIPNALLHFSIEDNVGHDFGAGIGVTHRTKILDPADMQWKDNVIIQTNGSGIITNGVQILSGDVVSQPRVIARWTNAGSTLTLGGIKCEFGPMTSKRGFPDPLLGEFTDWASKDTGWLCNFGQLEQVNDTTTVQLYLRFMDSSGNLQPVAGHQVKISLGQVRTLEGVEIYDVNESSAYLMFANGGTESSSVIASTDANGMAEVTLKAKGDPSLIGSVEFAAENLTQWVD